MDKNLGYCWRIKQILCLFFFFSIDIIFWALVFRNMQTGLPLSPMFLKAICIFHSQVIWCGFNMECFFQSYENQTHCNCITYIWGFANCCKIASSWNWLNILDMIWDFVNLGLLTGVLHQCLSADLCRSQWYAHQRVWYLP